MPSPAINIDTCVNAAFTADDLNAAKRYVDITEVDMYSINEAKHSSLVRAVTMERTEKGNRIAVIAFHKYEIERDRIF